ncbi:hypothetical protein L2E82_02116 [Cichorium intybus]|uniref:Uncharacterized protein n=1 Tax=Cichorium intybus TaxID=13427 RepID=A0ACB9H0F1_CICIN|nr:hypothetical protein L2E82_02116 [Cichorium intybus]
MNQQRNLDNLNEDDNKRYINNIIGNILFRLHWKNLAKFWSLNRYWESRIAEELKRPCGLFVKLSTESTYRLTFRYVPTDPYEGQPLNMVTILEFDFKVESYSDGLILLHCRNTFYLYNPMNDMLETLLVFLNYSLKHQCELVLAYDRDESVNNYKVVYISQEIGKRNEYDIRVFSSPDIHSCNFFHVSSRK